MIDPLTPPYIPPPDTTKIELLARIEARLENIERLTHIAALNCQHDFQRRPKDPRQEQVCVKCGLSSKPPE